MIQGNRKTLQHINCRVFDILDIAQYIFDHVTYAILGAINTAMAIVPKIIDADRIGKFFIYPPSGSRTKTMDVPVNMERLVLRVLLLQMHHLHIRRCGARYVYCRAKRVCNGT